VIVLMYGRRVMVGDGVIGVNVWVRVNVIVRV
jgi:hypothetical protein